MAERLEADQGIRPDETLDSLNGKYRLQFKAGGALVLYERETGQVLWKADYPRGWWDPYIDSADKIGEPLPRPNDLMLYMQDDGNLVVRLGVQTADCLLRTHTDGNPGSHVELQNDGNLVVYDAGHLPLWASFTDTLS